MKGKKKQKLYIPVAAAFLCLFPFLAKAVGFGYAITIGCYVELYVIAVSGMDIMFGYSGQISMGHAGFYAIGAYGSAIIHNYLGVPVLLSMVIASLLAALVGALIAYPCSKLQFHFLCLATIAFVNIIAQLLTHSPGGITGNYTGMFTDGINLFGYEITTYTGYFYFGLVCVALFLLLKQCMVHSKIGRAFTAIRDNVKAANGMGINVREYKILAFTASALFVGFAGAMYAHLVKYISPDTFTQKQSVAFLTMLLFGGVTSVSGTWVGALVLMFFTEVLRALTNWQLLIYGVLILLVITIMPGGVVGSVKKLAANVKYKKAMSKGEKADGTT